MNSKKFDERQLWIRGRIAFHGLLLALILVLANGFLQARMIVWASGFDQSLLIVIATVVAVSIEAMLRGVFFGKLRNRWLVIIIYGVCAIVIIALYGTFFRQGAAFLEDGGLSIYGANFLTGVMLAIATIVGVGKELSEKTLDKKNDSH